MDDTLFDKILCGEIPSTKVYEDDTVYAFKDIVPAAPVHVLVIPRFRLENLSTAASQDAADLGRFLQGVSKCATKLGLDKAGYRVVINNGPDAKQSVYYLHAHLLAGRELDWPPG